MTDRPKFPFGDNRTADADLPAPSPPWTTEPCLFCDGKGMTTDSLQRMTTCAVCNGAGSVRVPIPVQP